MTERELIEKGVKVRELFLEVENFPPMLQKFFDLDSDKPVSYTHLTLPTTSRV